MEGQSLVLCRDPGGQTKVFDVGGRGVGLNKGLYRHERGDGILKGQIKDAWGWGWRGCLGKLCKWVALF